MRDQIKTERLLNRTWKATLGTANGTGKSEAAAVKACLAEAVDILTHQESARFIVRDGYLIGSQIECSHSAWYFIKRLTDLAGDAQQRLIFPQCFLHPSELKTRIESQLTQYKQDDCPHVDFDENQNGDMTCRACGLTKAGEPEPA